MDKEREEKLMLRLAGIHARIQWMADQEARSAWVQGPAARGLHIEEKERLIERAERTLDELMGKLPPGST